MLCPVSVAGPQSQAYLEKPSQEETESHPDSLSCGPPGVLRTEPAARVSTVRGFEASAHQGTALGGGGFRTLHAAHMLDGPQQSWQSTRIPDWI